MEYRLSPAEVTRAFKRGMRRQIRLVRWGMPAILLAGAAICASVHVVAASAGLAAGAVAAPIAAAWAYRRLFSRMAALLCAPATVRVTGDEYEVRTELSTVTVRWAMFGRVESTPEFWLLYRGRSFAAFLPRAAFDDAQQAGIDSIIASRSMASQQLTPRPATPPRSAG